MPFRQFEYFLEVARCRSFNKAAQNLFISQQSLRASITSLEQKLNFPLLVRSRSGVCLSDQGEKIIGDIQNILKTAEGWRGLREDSVENGAVVQISASTAAYNAIMTSVAMECQTLWPQLSLRLFEYRENEMLRALMEKRMIGVLASAPEAAAEGRIREYAREHEFEVETICPDYFEVFFHAEHPLSEKKELSQENLRQFVLATYPDEEQNFHYRHLYDSFSPSTPIYMARQESICQIISREQHVAAVFPRIIKQGSPIFEQNKIISRPVRDYPMPAISCLIYPRRSELSAAEVVVLDMIRREFQKLELR